MELGNKVYNFFKSLALIYLPALATLYFALSGIWGLPFAQQVVGTITAVDTFLGVVLRISSASYNAPKDGQIVIDTSQPGKDTYSLNLTTPIEDLSKQAKVVFRVVNGGKA